MIGTLASRVQANHQKHISVILFGRLMSLPELVLISGEASLSVVLGVSAAEVLTRMMETVLSTTALSTTVSLRMGLVPEDLRTRLGLDTKTFCTRARTRL